MSGTHFSGLPVTPEAYRQWWAENTDVPYGYCWCGCGQKTARALQNSKRSGYVGGEPKRFVANHYNAHKSKMKAESKRVAPESKVCFSCGERKSITEFYRGTARQGYKDGYRNQCKTCHGKAGRDNTEKNRGATRARQRAWLKENPERRRAYKRTQYERRGEAIRQKERERRYKNKDKQSAAGKKWRASNPGKVRQQSAKRRARKLKQQIGEVDYPEILERDGYWCYLCELPVEPSDISYDHVVPLCKGGPHSMDNIKVTHWKCNHRKGGRLL